MRVTHLLVHDAVLKAVSENYSSSRNSSDVPAPRAIQLAFDEWNSDQATDTSNKKIVQTLGLFSEYLTSPQSPYSKEEQAEVEFTQLMNAVKPGGLLYGDMQIFLKFDSSAKMRLMKRFTGFMKDVAQVAKSGDYVRAKTALAQFPPRTEGEYQCVPGTFSRLFAAERQLDSPAVTTLTAGYSDAIKELLVDTKSKVSKSNDAHVDPAINYLMGVPNRVVEQVDRYYRTPLPKISALNTWKTYRATLCLGGDIRDRVDLQVKTVVGDESPEEGKLFNVENQKTFFTPWGIELDAILEGFYDDTFQIQRRVSYDLELGLRTENDHEFNNRLQSRVAKAISDKLNQHVGYVEKSDYIQWEKLDTQTMPNIPSVKELLSGQGVHWIAGQLGYMVCNDYVLRTVEQKAALHALFVFSESLADPKPAMVIEVLHRLGGGNTRGIERGKEILDKIAQSNPNLLEIVEKIKSRIDYLTGISGLETRVFLKGVKEFADFLRHSTITNPELLVKQLINEGTSNEVIVDFIDAVDKTNTFEYEAMITRVIFQSISEERADVFKHLIKKYPTLLYAKDDITGLYTPFEYAVKCGNLEVVKYLVENEPNPLHEEVTTGWSAALALDIAISNNRANIIEYLVRKYPKVLGMFNGIGNTPVLTAVHNGDADILKLVLSFQNDSLQLINVRNNRSGITPLLRAATFGQDDIIKVLLNAGADKNMRDSSGATAKDLALLNGYEETAKLFEG